jgi:hypothetical protein
MGRDSGTRGEGGASGVCEGRTTFAPRRQSQVMEHEGRNFEVAA